MTDFVSKLRSHGLAIGAAIVMTASSLLVATTAYAGDGPMIKGAWARPSIGSTGNSAAYMKVMNHGDAADRLVDAKSDVARKTELHTHIMEGNVAKMRRVEGGVEVPAKGDVEFKPGGLHVMLIGLKSKLAEGDSFPLTLVFEKKGEVVVDVKVQKGAGKSNGGHDHDHNHD